MALTYYALTFLAGAAVLLLLLRIHLLHSDPPPGSTKPAPFPTGPPTLPLLGNLHQLARPKAFLALAAWARDPSASTATGLIGLRLGSGGGGSGGGSSRAVVLTKWTHVRDLFDARGRGAVYADRPRFAVAERVLPGGDVDLNVVLSRHGARWRRARRTVVGFLGDAAMARGVERVQDAEGCQMVWELWRFCGEESGGGGGGGAGGEDDEISGPKAYHRYSMRYSGAVILASVFGVRGKEAGPRGWAGRFFTVQDEFVHLLEGGIVPPVDIFPWLKYVPDFLTPWKGWRKRVDDLGKAQSGLYHELVSETLARVEAGKAKDSFMATTIKNQEAAASSGRTKDIYSRLELDYIGGFLMEAGADTSTMAFESWLLAMVAHPEIQKQAQEEIDAVYGPDEMPHALDGKKLPFLKACFLETLRWRTPLPNALPHANSADDVYEGYFIPKGTTIIPNMWAISHDPDEFEDPSAFNPHRYIANPFGVKVKDVAGGDGSEAGLDADAVEEAEMSSSGRRQTYAFGAGRRVCAGSRMGEDSMMMAMAKVVWCFDMVSATGEKPDVEMATAYRDAILTGPKTFPMKFVLRDERKGDVIKQEWEKADDFLRKFE